jgi:hypothetical protein
VAAKADFLVSRDRDLFVLEVLARGEGRLRLVRNPVTPHETFLNGRRNGCYSLRSVDAFLAIAAGGLALLAGYLINYIIKLHCCKYGTRCSFDEW